MQRSERRSQQDLAVVAREIIDANRYLTLATADSDGRPWATPAWHAHQGHTDLLWVSRPEARHSRNLASRPRLAIVIFDSTVPLGAAQAVYVEASAQELSEAIVDSLSWRWIFYINLPVGAVALVAAQRLLPEAKPQFGQRLDLRGLALLSSGIALFLYGMSQAGNAGAFDATTTAATAAGLALVALFVWRALASGERALIDLSLFRRRGFAAAAPTSCSRWPCSAP